MSLRSVLLIMTGLTVYGIIFSNALAITSAQFKASATISPGCEIVATGNVLGSLDFGTHSATTAESVAGIFVQDSSFSLSCTPGVALSMKVDGGKYSTGQRHVLNEQSGERIPYKIFSDAAHANEINIDQIVSLSVENSNAIMLPIYALLQLSGFHSSGVYADTLTVTLTW